MTDFINSLLGTTFSDAVAFAAVAAGILILILGLWLLIRMVSRPGIGSRRSKKARIAITDAARVDDRRRLLLVRRDDVEHLILIGGANDLVVESSIEKPAATATPPAKREVPTAPSRPPAAPIRPTVKREDISQKAETTAKLPKAEEPLLKPTEPAVSPEPKSAALEAKPALKPLDEPTKPSAVDEMNALLGDIRPKR